MGCNCGRSAKANRITGYEVVTPDGQRRVFLTQTEAKIAMAAAGGGTATPITK
ncbi:DUF7196 family protein [Rhodococcus koreensis]